MLQTHPHQTAHLMNQARMGVLQLGRLRQELFRPVQSGKSLFWQSQLFAADRKLVQLHCCGFFHSDKIIIGFFIISGLQMGGRAVVSDGAQYLLIIQRLSQTPGNAVLQIHVFNVDSVAVAVSHIDSGKHHGMDIPLPGGHVIGVVQIFQSGCIAFSPLIQRDSCSQTDIYAGIKLHGLLIPALHHPLQSKPMRVKKGLQLPGSRLLGICQKTMKQGRIQGMGTV